MREPVLGVQAKPPRFGIYAALAPSALSDGARWQDGFSFQPEQCGVSGATTVDCGGNTAQLELGDRPSVVDGDPFAVYADDVCSTFGWLTRDPIGRATRQLVATRSYQIAREVWTGELGAAAGLANVPLADPAADTVSTSPMAVRKALACVEQAVSDCCQGCVGLIHVTPQVLTELAAFGSTVMLSGNTWVTANGHVVIPDAGYTGTGPNGEPAGESQWIYGTSMMALRLSETWTVPENEQDVRTQADRATNLIAVRAYQLVAYQWDTCCHFAAEVDVPTCAVGGAS